MAIYGILLMKLVYYNFMTGEKLGIPITKVLHRSIGAALLQANMKVLLVCVLVAITLVNA